MTTTAVGTTATATVPGSGALTDVPPDAATDVMGRRARAWHRQEAFVHEPAWEDDDEAWGVSQEEPPVDREPVITPDPLTGQGGTQGAWGQILAHLDPGPLLAAELEAIEARSVDEYDLVEMTAAYQRIAAWAHGRMVEMAGVLSRRPALNPRYMMPGGEEYATNVAAEELAPRLGVSRFAAKRMVTNAREFRHDLASTSKALRAGKIDYGKACTLVRLLADQPAEVALCVQELVLPRAGQLSHTELTKAVQEAIIAIDPHHATARHRRARAGRRVDHPRPLPDGMASIFAILPATDAAGLDLALEGAARHARAGGDDRTLDQLRADALSTMGHTALDQGFIGLAPEAPAAGQPSTPGATREPSAPEAAGQQGRLGAVERPDVPVAGQSGQTGEGDGGDRIVIEDPGGGLSAMARWVLGYSEHPADAAVDVGAMMQTGGAYRRTLHMPVGGIGGRRTQVKVTVPLSVLIPPEFADPASRGPGVCCAHFDPTDPDLGLYDSPAPPGADGPGPTRCTCRLPEPLDEEIDPGTPGHGRESEPFDETAHGEADHGHREEHRPWEWALAEVAELDGYGPITPDVARALAMSADTWQRLVTDPLSGALLDVGRSRYRPPAAVAEFVRYRDRTCVRPGCSSPAQGCDLDHVLPWERGGITAVGNLASLCRRDHLTKTVGAFELEHLGDGVFEWTTPTGHRYRRDHRGHITMAPRRRFTPDDGDPPPF